MSQIQLLFTFVCPSKGKSCYFFWFHNQFTPKNALQISSHFKTELHHHFMGLYHHLFNQFLVLDIIRCYFGLLAVINSTKVNILVIYNLPDYFLRLNSCKWNLWYANIEDLWQLLPDYLQKYISWGCLFPIVPLTWSIIILTFAKLKEKLV